MARTVRTSLDIPEDLHRRIHDAAKRRGCSAQTLILSSIEREVEFESSGKCRVKVPLVLGKGQPVIQAMTRSTTSCFLDISVWLAIVVERHVFKRAASAW